MEKLKEMLMKEIEAVENKGKLDYNVLDMVGKVLDDIKDIHEIKCMERKLTEPKYSEGRGYYIEQHDHFPDDRHDYSEGRYYMDSDSKYRKMLEEAKTDEERELIRRLMEVKKY